MPDLLARRRAAGLTGAHDRMARAGKARREPRLLGRLARSLAALEGDEVARHGQRDPAAAVFFAVVFFAAVFFAVVFFAADFFTTRLVVFFGARPSSASLDRRSDSRSLARSTVIGGRVVRRAQRGVGRAVGDVRAEAAVLDHHREPGRRVVADLAQRRLDRAATALLGLREQRQRLLERDGEDLLLAAQRARVLVLGQVGAVAAVLREDLDAVGGIDADQARQAEQAQRLLERDRRQAHAGEQRGRARLGRLGRALRQDLGHVRSVAAGLGDDGQARVGIGAQLAVARRLGEQLLGLLGRELVGGEVDGDVGPLLSPRST